MLGKLHSVETFGTVDGPGVRYVVFMQGCPLRCGYCHNVDSQNINAGYTESAENLVKDILKYTNYITGVTASGGEPLMQIDFLIEVFTALKKHGLTAALDTSGIVFNKNDANILKKIDALLNVTDLVLLDIKHIDSEKHKKLTGAPNTNVLEFAKYLSTKNIPMWIRYVLVPTINDDEESLYGLKEFVAALKSVQKIEVLPYHTLGVEKYKKLGISYPLEGIKEPTKEEVQRAKNILGIQGE